MSSRRHHSKSPRHKSRKAIVSIVDSMAYSKHYKIISRVPVSKETLPKIRVSRLMPEGHGECARCGIKATSVLTYTLATEDHKRIYSNIFAGKIMLTADHILPRALGGADALSNLQLMCYTCNTKKGMSLSQDDIELIIKDRSKHLRATFLPVHMRHVLKLHPSPSLALVYNLDDIEGPAEPFKRHVPQMRSLKRTDDLVTDKHLHSPNWGWVRIFDKYPDLRAAVSFYRELPFLR